jgi:hypothetical protein
VLKKHQPKYLTQPGYASAVSTDADHAADAKVAEAKAADAEEAGHHEATVHREEVLTTRIAVLEEHPGTTVTEKDAVAKEKAAHEAELGKLQEDTR